MKKALLKSLSQESKYIEDRFSRAESVLNGGSLTESRPAVPTKTPKRKGAAVNAKPRVVRDTYSMMQSDYDLIRSLRKRCMMMGIDCTHSEIVRASIQHIANNMSEEEIEKMLGAITKLKPGPGKQV